MTKELQEYINQEAAKEKIYEPKYGGKDHSGYDTMMLYEINYVREEMFAKGATLIADKLMGEMENISNHNKDIIKDLQAQREQLSQLSKENERLKELLREIHKSLYYGEDLKDGETLDFYMRVVGVIKEEIQAMLKTENNL